MFEEEICMFTINIYVGILKFIVEKFGPNTDNRDQEIILAIIGVNAALIGIWVPAFYMDWGSSEAGATLVAMFF
jgi:hypothetical protein